MNTILLQPTDVLFFRDGRPMEGSLAGHGAAWPMPNVINAAFHAALHRATLDGVHEHRRGARGIYTADARRDRKFGSLLTAGPFPVSGSGEWYFPRPADLCEASLQPSMLPGALREGDCSSLPAFLRYALMSRLAPSKDTGAKGWLSQHAYRRYIENDEASLHGVDAVSDSEFCDTEHSIGIQIDSATQTTGQGEAAGQIYSAHYLRLRDGWRMGVVASAWDKVNGSAEHNRDLLLEFLQTDGHIIVGGQQRVCTASRLVETVIHLPRGRTKDFHQRNGTWLVKWILLSPAIWPKISDQDPNGNPIVDHLGKPILQHGGGWLPNWIHPHTGEVLLRRRRGVRRDYSGAKARRVADSDESISARLAAALVPKPIVVTGWSLPDEVAGEKGGAQSSHFAVPAGAVYYFEADSETDAARLAAVLNWHGGEEADGRNPQSGIIKNRRSTLLGEKGFGLGACGTWDFYENVSGRSAARNS
jgi:CRISPR-associated protein Cmr3